MTTLAELHAAKFGPSNWPANFAKEQHGYLDAVYLIVDAELDSDAAMHRQFWTLQAAYVQPRADMMRWVEQQVWRIVQNNFGSTYSISKYGCQLVAYSIIKLWIDKSYIPELREDNIEEKA